MAFNQKKIAMVTSILPETNYSSYLIEALQKNSKQETMVLVYTSREKNNLKTNLENVKLIWDKKFIYIFQICYQALKDKPKIVHIQHEINMFGGFSTALAFPLLPLLLKTMGLKVIVTIHAIVSLKEINEEFLEIFWPSKKKFLIPLIKIFFNFLFKTTGFLSDEIIVHSQGLKNILIRDYHLNTKKVFVIPMGVPDKISRIEKASIKIQKHFDNNQFILYYGYLHRRKKIELLLETFYLINKKYPNLSLVISGGTLQKDYEEKLKNMALNLKIHEKVIFLGFVKEKDLHWLIDRSLFVLFPAAYSISASGPMSQIIAHHKPAIISRIGVYQEDMQDESETLLAKNSISDWKEKIEKLLHDQNLIKKIKVNLEKKHQQRKWSIIAEKNYDLYRLLF